MSGRRGAVAATHATTSDGRHDLLTVGGLFSGIGGIELGLERAGMQILWHAESDEFCQHILSERWPGVPCFPDVRDLVADTNGAGSEARSSNGLRGVARDVPGQPARPSAQSSGGALPVPVPYVDVLCGGFPCQDISLAGAGAGIREGTRSGLWYEFARLIRELRPRYVIVENVSALLARGLDVVLGDLAACGYDAEWDCIPASAVGAPHRRDRVWIVAYPRRERGESRGGSGDVVRAAGQAEGQGLQRQRGWRAAVDSSTGGAAVPNMADAHREGPQGYGREHQLRALGEEVEARGSRGDGRAPAIGRGSSPEGPWAVEPDVGRVADGVPARVDRLRSLGNAVVPQIAEWIGSRIVAYEAEVTSAREAVLR
jgi:DNA (cytosine-5)-methyltransferase 1